MASATKVLIVDDSALMRKALSAILDDAGGFETRTARNGVDALEQITAFAPDVITLDINMPEMDGLTALSHIMVSTPRPVIMVSSLTESGALATLEALELGAVDFVTKPGGTVSLNIDEIAPLLVRKLRAAARSRVRRGSIARPRIDPVRAPPKQVANQPASVPGAVIIGVSTGGPRALEKVLPALPASFPYPIVVAQHMPATFTATLAKRLDTQCALEVIEVSKPTPLRCGTVHIGRGDADVVLTRRAGTLTALSVPPDRRELWHPSVDRLVRSTMAVLPADLIVGVQLTGMGYDGAASMSDLHAAGGRTVAESEESATIFGMPAELIKRGGASCVLDAMDIAAQLQDWLRDA